MSKYQDILALNLSDCIAALKKGEIKPTEYLDAQADWISDTNQDIGAFTAIDFDLARQTVRAKDFSDSPLAGLPLAIKDLIHVENLPTSCASEMLRGFQPPFEATVIERLRNAGAVFYGKLNMDEFAMGSSNETSAFGPVKNPWNLEYTPGGSSGGSAAAVAAWQTPGTLGSDTGGSIRQPAAFCGITGLKPTYGRVSRYGLVAFASSLDQIGPMGRSAKDCALLLQAIAGHDSLDGTSSDHVVPEYLRHSPKLSGLKVGIPEEYFGDGLEDDVRQAVKLVESWLADAGADLVPINLPHTAYTIATYYLITSAEASSNLGRFDGMRYGLSVEGEGLVDSYEKTRGAGFGPEVKRRIMLGTFALSSGYYDAYYGKAQKARTLIRRDFERAFENVDVLLTPTTPTTAFKLGEKIDDPLQMYLNDIYTNGTNLAGLPGISFPCGFDQTGLPIGAQLIGRPFDEDLLLGITDLFQTETEFHKKRAPYLDKLNSGSAAS